MRFILITLLSLPVLGSGCGVEKNVSEAGSVSYGRDSLDVSEELRFISDAHDNSVRYCRYAIESDMALPNYAMENYDMIENDDVYVIALINLSFNINGDAGVSIPFVWIYENGDLVFNILDNAIVINNYNFDLPLAEEGVMDYLKSKFGSEIEAYNEDNCSSMELKLPYWSS